MASHWLLACAQRKVMMASAPLTVQCILDCLSRWPMTALQPASTTPELMNRLGPGGQLTAVKRPACPLSCRRDRVPRGRGRPRIGHGHAARHGRARAARQPRLSGRRQVVRVLPQPAASEADRQALVQDEESPFFTSAHIDDHLSVLVRAIRLGELTLAELTEVVQDAWVRRPSSRRAS